MNCGNCLYRHINWRDGGYCYMFKDKPKNKHCGQYRAVLGDKARIRIKAPDNIK